MPNNYNKSHIKTVIYFTSSVLMVSMLASAILANIAQHFPQAAESTVRLILTMPPLVGIVCALLAGPLSTRVPKKLLMLVGASSMLLGGILSLLFGPQSIGLLIGAAMLIGVGQGSLASLSSSLVTEYFEGAECQGILGRQSVFVNGGAMALVFIAGWLSRISWNMSYLVYLILAPVILVTLLFLPIHGPEDAARAQASRNRDKAKIKITPRVFYICIVLFVFATLFSVFTLTVSDFVQSNGLGDSATAGTANTMISLAGCIGGLLYSHILRLVKKFIFFTGIVIAAFGFLQLYAFGGLANVFVAAFCCGIGLTLMMPSSLFAASGAVDTASSSTAVALVNASSNFGMFMVSILIPPIVGAFGGGGSTYFIVGAVGLLALGVIALADVMRSAKNK